MFLLVREGRLDEAAAARRSILDRCEACGYELNAEWPRRELARLEAATCAATPDVGVLGGGSHGG